MKANYVIVNVCITFGLLSCLDGGLSTYDQYSLVNESGCSIQVLIYDRNSRAYKGAFDLIHQGDQWISERIKTSEPGGSIEPPHLVIGGDSVNIIYNDSTSVGFAFPDYERVYGANNILIYDNYDRIDISDTERILRYTFTEDDCELAYLK